MSVAVACLVYLECLSLLSLAVKDAAEHEAGYIGAMLFVIPGFPLITSGLDIAKLDFRSGLERLAYACAVIVVATLVAWLVAMMVELHPDDFAAQGLSAPVMFALRLVASFVGVFGFSMMFNSTYRMAATAGAVCAGLLASITGTKTKFPRISITVPSIVIMVPGLYMYRAVYYMGVFQTLDAMEWIIRAIMIILFLPMGLGLARALTDPD